MSTDPDLIALALLRAEKGRREDAIRTDWRGIGCKWHSAEVPYVPPVLNPDGTVATWFCRHARPDQLLPDGKWTKWLLLAGRGFGKTRALVEALRELIDSGRYLRPALWGRTTADVRDTLILGQSGFISVYPLHEKPVYTPSNRSLIFPNGVRMTLYSAEEPDMARGPEHDLVGADELAAWKSPEAAWDNAMLGLRIGVDPKAIVATTPRPIALIKRLLADPNCRMTRGSTYENLPNLAPVFAEEILAAYKNTRLERQELLGEVLDDVEGAFWTTDTLDASRWKSEPEKILWTLDNLPDLVEIVVAVDPATTHTKTSDSTGVAVMARDAAGHAYVLDAFALKLSPSDWARKVVQTVADWDADTIVIEDNQGGEMVETLIRQAMDLLGVSCKVRRVHSAVDKGLRAGPTVGRYDQLRIHHIGQLKALEEQMVVFPVEEKIGDDIVDALVHADRYLFPKRSRRRLRPV